MVTGPEAHAEPAPPARLSRRERIFLGTLSALTVPAAFAALKTAFFASLSFEGPASLRDSSISNHAMRAALWAIITPFVAWLILRRARLAWFGVAVWFGLLVWASPWWWPTPPTDVFNTDAPLWRSSAGIILWLLVAASLAVGLYASFRSHSARATRMAFGLVVAALALGAWSNVRLVQHAHTERSAPLEQGTTELTALRADPFWASLPRSPRTTAHGEHGATLTVWGERTPTTVWRYLGERYDSGLFMTLVALAERNGWQLRGTSCYEHGSWDAVFSKELTVGNARMRIAVATYLHGVGVDAEIADIGYPGKPGKCWAPSP